MDLIFLYPKPDSIGLEFEAGMKLMFQPTSDDVQRHSASDSCESHDDPVRELLIQALVEVVSGFRVSSSGFRVWDSRFRA